MLITLLAIATELHLLFSNKSSICIDYEDLDNLFNRICSEKLKPSEYNICYFIYSKTFKKKRENISGNARPIV